MPNPGLNVTSTSSPNAERNSSSATSTRVGLTWELPAPWNRGVCANSPITATVLPGSGFSGSTAPSFFSSTADSWAARRATAWCSSKSTGRRIVQRRLGALDQPQHPPYGLVEHRLVELAGA